MNVKLGDKVTDSITGFKGIATGRHTYLTGCDQITVTPECRDNTLGAVAWFEEDRLILSVEDLARIKVFDVEEQK